MMQTDLKINLPLIKFNFILKAKEELVLPPYKGSTLRGGFGISFRRMCCVNKKLNSCSNCSLKEKCVYAYIFETSPSKDTVRLRNLTEIPRPFVIEPPAETKIIYQKGEILEFALILIGRAIDYIPYFIFTFKELGDIGIGKSRGKYELFQVNNVYQETIYHSQDETIKNFESRIKPNSNLSAILFSIDCITLSFTTPTRIKFRDDLGKTRFSYINKSATTSLVFSGLLSLWGGIKY